MPSLGLISKYPLISNSISGISSRCNLAHSRIISNARLHAVNFDASTRSSSTSTNTGTLQQQQFSATATRPGHHLHTASQPAGVVCVAGARKLQSVTPCHQLLHPRSCTTRTQLQQAAVAAAVPVHHHVPQRCFHHQCCSSAALAQVVKGSAATQLSTCKNTASEAATGGSRNSLVTRQYSTGEIMDLKALQEAKSKFTPPDNLGTKVPPAEVRRFMTDCLTSVGVEVDKAQQMAEVLVSADVRGHFSHGLNRLEMYVNDVRAKICNGNAVPTITKESVSTALVNGNNGLGPVVGKFSMDLAISKAKETGIGWVCARGSNHYGIAGWYAMRASDQGMLGMSFTNTSPLVAPTRAKGPALGTNPLALAAPGKEGDPFVLDMATCTVAVGKIEVCRRKGDSIPEGWALDKSGKLTTDPAEAMGGALMPLGGIESNSGYKGYGLAMMVEIFCGLLSGGAYGPNVRRWMDTTKEADLGQCFVAIDPSFFAPGFPDRMSDLMDHCRNMDPADPAAPVLAAGDPERAHITKVAAEGGLNYHANQITDSWKLANVLNVKPMAGV